MSEQIIKQLTLSLCAVILGSVYLLQVSDAPGSAQAQSTPPTITKTSSGKIFFDNFNRPDLGADYIAQGVAKARWTISNNRLRFVSNAVVGSAGLRHATAAMSGELVADFSLSTNTQTSIAPGLVAQKTNNGNFTWQKNPTNLQVIRNTSTTATTVIDQPRTLPLNQDHRVKLQFGSTQPNAVKLWLNEEPLGTATSTAPTLNTGSFMFQVLSFAQNGVAEYDNLAIYRSTNLTVMGVTGSWGLFANDGQSLIGNCNTTPTVDYAKVTSFPADYAQGPATQIQVFANSTCQGQAVATYQGSEAELIFGGDVYSFDPGVPEPSPSPTPTPSPTPEPTPEASPEPSPSSSPTPSPSAVPNTPMVTIKMSHPRRFSFGDQPYYILGLGDCVDPDQNGNFLDDWYIGLPNEQAVDLNTYLDTYAAAGFNTIRLNNANCSPVAYSFAGTVPNALSINMANTEKYRQMMAVIKNHPGNWKILYTFFGFQEVPQLNNTASLNTEAMNNVCQAINHAVTNYGEYVDFWEVLNEKKPKNQDWNTFAVNCVKAADPLDRLITTSWEQPRSPLFNFDDIHDYQQESEFESDNRVWQWRLNTLSTNRPAFFGEFGNAVCNWDTNHATRLEIHAYLSIFSEVGMIWWNTSNHTNYCPTNSTAANAYLGPDERAKVKEVAEFAASLPASASVTSVTTVGAIDAYALTWQDNGGGGVVYVVADQAGLISNSAVTLNIPGRGSQLLVIPDFTSSYLYRIE